MQKRAFLALAAIAWFGCDNLEVTKQEPEKSAPEAAAKGEPEAQPETKKEPGDTKATPLVDPTKATPLVEAPPADANTADERNTIEVFRAAAPATVFVTQKALQPDFLARRYVEVPAGAGTGFVWDEAGHIVTNCHVAVPNCQGPAPKLSVTLFDQKSYDATLVGVDPFKDIAVLRIDARESKLTPIRRPPKGYALEVGQKTVAIGNPFGLDHTLTVGVVSALGREVKGVAGVTIRGMVQTDAAINPGNSGGPLLDSRGQLIGMNTMIFSTSGSAAGIGFAVPVTSIERIVPQIIRTGRPERVGLGIEIVDARTAALRLGVTGGVVVDKVDPETPAGKAGLLPIAQATGGFSFDVIVGVDDKKIESFDDLFGALDEKAEGDKVRVQVRRLPKDEVVTLEIALVKLRQ